MGNRLKPVSHTLQGKAGGLYYDRAVTVSMECSDRDAPVAECRIHISESESP